MAMLNRKLLSRKFKTYQIIKNSYIPTNTDPDRWFFSFLFSDNHDHSLNVIFQHYFSFH